MYPGNWRASRATPSHVRTQHAESDGTLCTYVRVESDGWSLNDCGVLIRNNLNSSTVYSTSYDLTIEVTLYGSMR